MYCALFVCKENYAEIFVETQNRTGWAAARPESAVSVSSMRRNRISRSLLAYSSSNPRCEYSSHLTHSSFMPAKSVSSRRMTVALTTRSREVPAALRMAEIFCRHCLVCSWMVSPTIFSGHRIVRSRA